ncbi:MAG: hypothetical protein JWM89_3954 [Acidimicrobiales bacterium]|nr:hypothetical protein [Acidimicrobiales bacterium]
MGNTVVDPSRDMGKEAMPGEPHLGWVVAGCSVAAAVIHFAMVPVHAGSGLTDPLGFAIVGWFQLAIAAVILTGRDNRRVYTAAAVGNLAVIGLWVLSRTVGLPVGSHKGIVEEVAAIDLLCAVLEGVVVVFAVRLLLDAGRPRVTRLAPALAAIAALGVATTVIAAPDAASHSSTSTVDATTALKAKIDGERCDTGFNIPAYWKEAKKLGVDTYEGGALVDGAPAAAAPVNESAPHSHSAGASVAGGTTTTTQPDPTEGRGSFVLDQLVTDTSKAGGGEGAAAKLVVDLADASDREYDNWLWWLKGSGTLSHAHTATTSTSGDGGGHGGHVGPQLWTAMTDQSQCDKLSGELAVARKTALSYGTVAQAKQAGYALVTGYVPGIAAHFIKYDLIDGRFEITKPEMLLYDGTGPTARIVGLSYYIWHEGDAEPTQGFTGANDHGHRHIGLCSGKGGEIIGDSTTTAEDCAARGGTKDTNSAGWMYHAWVVPGCESPWGVFSAATPVLDRGTTMGSGKDGGHCASSQVRDRYAMKPTKGTKAVKYDPKAASGYRRTGGRGDTSKSDQAERSTAATKDVGGTPQAGKPQAARQGG